MADKLRPELAQNELQSHSLTWKQRSVSRLNASRPRGSLIVKPRNRATASVCTLRTIFSRSTIIAAAMRVMQGKRRETDSLLGDTAPFTRARTRTLVLSNLDDVPVWFEVCGVDEAVCVSSSSSLPDEGDG